MKQKPILISGIQPSGKLHLGNYFGAIKNFIELQNSGKYDCHFFIADLHSLTEDFTPREKTDQIINLAADYLALGIDPKKSVIYKQSDIPQTSELMWFLTTITPLGELSRMTQFKEKSDAQKINTNAGLLMYPVLMAADILLLNASFVPVGEDQLQHLELARTLARRFNNKFGEIFKEPEALLTETPRLMSLDSPDKKMSKSMPDGCIFLDDEPEAIVEKVKKAVTDSGGEVRYDVVNKPAISNLMQIYKAVTKESFERIEELFAGKGYGGFKSALAEQVINYFANYRVRKAEFYKDREKINNALNIDAERVRHSADKTIDAVKSALGLNLRVRL